MSNNYPQTHPKFYDLPHDEWRPEQFETLQWLNRSDKKVRILEAATGSGKTSTATAFAHDKKSISLVQTKLLQEENYGNIYSWDVLFGKSNYSCVHDDADSNTTAEECKFASKEGGMKTCPVSDACPYLKKKSKVIRSNRASLNYAYYLLSSWPRTVGAELLIMDEAHMLSDITLNFAGISIHDETRMEWGLPMFPDISSLSSGSSMFFTVSSETPNSRVADWINKSISILAPREKMLSTFALSKTASKKDIYEWRKCKNLISELQNTLNMIDDKKGQWFIESKNDLMMYRGRLIPGLIAKPLTARHHFSDLFLGTPNTLMMSATIGNIDAFAEELGIEDYDFKSVPSIWPPETRPIYALDAPRMGYKSQESDYEKQADVIAKAIKECPSDWQGVIHVSRISEAPLMAQRLSMRGLASRVWIPPQRTGTNVQIQDWNYFKKSTRGAIAIVYSWSEGVDLFDEKICIVAKTPFFPLGDPFEAKRQRAYPKFYLQRTAWKLIQSLGRTRRGEADHYDVNGDVNGFVAIADANWTRVKSYISQDILDSIVTL